MDSLITTGQRILDFRLIHHNRRYNAHLNIVLTEFADSVIAEDRFEKIRRSGTDKDDGPGLTYASDAVLLEGVRMVWFNAPCSISIKNHRLLAEYFFTRLGFTEKAKSIWCECGAVYCN